MVETKPTDITGGLPLEGFRRLFFVYVLGSKHGIRSIVIHPAMGILTMVHIYIYVYTCKSEDQQNTEIHVYIYILLHLCRFIDVLNLIYVRTFQDVFW